MSQKPPLRPKLWTERSVEDTIGVYKDWAATYDTDVTTGGYHTPARIAEALKTHLTDATGPILDFGCGTGISGAALKQAGLGPLHGTDITREMIDIAATKGVYDKLWLGVPGEVPAGPGTYRAIVAAGVVSLGAAPPETLDLLVQSLEPGGLIALSFNDPTLKDGRYDRALSALVDGSRLKVLYREHGPHLDDMDMGSDVIVLKRL